MKNIYRGIRGIRRRARDENVFDRLNGLREEAQACILCRGPGPARKQKEVYGMPAVEWRKKKAHRGALVAMQTRVKPTWGENVNCTRGVDCVTR